MLAEAILLLGGKGALPVSGIALFLMFYASLMPSRIRKRGRAGIYVPDLRFLRLHPVLPVPVHQLGLQHQGSDVPSVQIIMFGMGTKLSLADFAREFRSRRRS